MIPRPGRVLGRFHHRVARRLTGQQPWRGVGVCIPPWRKIWIRWGYRSWVPTSPAARTQLHSSLLPFPLCTCVWKHRGFLGHGWPSGCGDSKAWTCRWCGQRIVRRKRRRGGGVWDGDEYGRLIRWEYNVANLILGTYPNNPLDYSPVLELCHQIMSMLGGHGGQLER